MHHDMYFVKIYRDESEYALDPTCWKCNKTKKISIRQTPLLLCMHKPPYPVAVLYEGSNYNDAAASTAPAPLKSLGLVTTISTGYFHSMNLAQPEMCVSHVVAFSSFPKTMGTYPNMHTSCQSTSPRTEPPPWSAAIPIAAMILSILFPRLICIRRRRLLRSP